MKKVFTKFNIICLSLDIIFLLGIVWVWRNILSFDHPVTTSQPVFTSQQITNNKLETVDNNGIVVTSTTGMDDLSVLPRDYVLDVPFTSQAPEKNWDQPWQDACEEASLLMLDAYYKDYNLSQLFARDEILKIVKWEEKKNWGTSIEIEKVKEISQEYFKLNGFETVENPTVEQIKKSIVSGHPVLVVADGKLLPNPHFSNDGPVYHALVIKGYDEDEFITNDPGTQFGKNFKYKYDDLMNAIRDWNGGDVKNGRRVVLMVE